MECKCLGIWLFSSFCWLVFVGSQKCSYMARCYFVHRLLNVHVTVWTVHCDIVQLKEPSFDNGIVIVCKSDVCRWCEFHIACLCTLVCVVPISDRWIVLRFWWNTVYILVHQFLFSVHNWVCVEMGGSMVPCCTVVCVTCGLKVYLDLCVFFWFSLDYFVPVSFAFVVLDLVSSVLSLICQEIGYEERLWNDLFCVRLDVKAINRLVLHFCAVAVGWLLWSSVICVFCRQSLVILNINFIPALMSTNSLVTQLEKNIVDFVKKYKFLW